MGVAPDQRGSGLAADLYARFFAIARAAGSVRVKAVTSPLNEVSQRFHASLGFTVSDAGRRLRRRAAATGSS